MEEIFKRVKKFLLNLKKMEILESNKSPVQIWIGLIAVIMFAFVTKEGYETYQVNSVRVSNCKSWGLGFSEEGKAPSANESPEELAKYDSYYIGDINSKKISLSFDVGYDNGYTAKILDTLKEKKVTAAFFLVGNFVDSHPELVKRMKSEGHIIGNHTNGHKDMTTLSDVEFQKEVNILEEKLNHVIGTGSDYFYRPPQGKYSIKNLEDIKKMGYKTCFWSLAYVDWYEDQQPTREEAMDKLLGRIHNGAIVLLHSTSKTNCEILGDLIDEYRDMGYEIVSLDELINF